jgi:hypothetical protein
MCAVQQGGNSIITDLARKFRDIGKKFSSADSWQIAWQISRAGFHQVK